MERARRTLVVLALAAIAAGAFQPFYLKVWRQDAAAVRAFMTELPYRKVPGLRHACVEAGRRLPTGARVLLVTPHQTWDGGYDYAFRRAQYLLAGRDLVPMLPPAQPEPRMTPDFVLCVPACAVPPGFSMIWRDDAGLLLERRK